MSNRRRLPKPKKHVCKECLRGDHTGREAPGWRARAGLEPQS
jgi:hypothetical protein